MTGAAGTKRTPKIKEVRAYVVQEDECGADYHRQPQDHWIVQEISNPMSGYPKYKKNRTTYVSYDTITTLLWNCVKEKKKKKKLN